MKIVIVSGGTGGHIYPGIAIADEITSSHPAAEILFLGGREGLEGDVVPKAGYRIKLIWARALLRKLSYKAVSAPFVSLVGFFQALNILRKFAPQALLSTGGYASLPVVLAARLLRVPIYIHEQNVLPGVTNRLLARWAKEIFLSFEQSHDYLKGTVTGNPVRREIMAADREKSRHNLGYGPQDTVVFIMGGSQGARSINQTVIASLPRLASAAGRIKLIHVVGNRDAGLVDSALRPGQYPFYRKVNYLYNVAEMLAAADLAVSRAGATAIAEFTCRGLPMVLVPFPYSAEGHQDLNARVVAAAGAGIFVANSEFTPERFISLISDKGLDLSGMRRAAKLIGRPDAAARIVERIYSHTKMIGMGEG
jgi:UDP-N-acetylglucosamine--N-acetylmuramyl-(pentapeptide) pyrophosphoryl-undecaprenol N-acetylglucosamine transferase